MLRDDKDFVKSLVTQLNRDVLSVQISRPYCCNYWIINENEPRNSILIVTTEYNSSSKSSIWESQHGRTNGMKRQPNKYQGTWISLCGRSKIDLWEARVVKKGKEFSSLKAKQNKMSMRKLKLFTCSILIPLFTLQRVRMWSFYNFRGLNILCEPDNNTLQWLLITMQNIKSRRQYFLSRPS